MIYRKAVTIPTGTEAAAAIESSIQLAPGTIERIQITFPSGCLGLVGVRLLQQRFQLVPLTPGEWVVSDDSIVPQAVESSMLERPYELTFVGYNLDDTYDHTIQVQCEVRLPDTIDDSISQAITDTLPNLLNALLGTVVEIQQTVSQSVLLSQSEVADLLKQILASQSREESRAISDMSLRELATLPVFQQPLE
jgi:hypothetical protein